MKTIKILSCSLAIAGVLGSLPVIAANKTDGKLLARGKYLVKTSGCNDCHTAGYPESGGKIPEAKWLLGNPVGFQGPWGTTYPANLRLYMSKLSEKQWLQVARKPLRPPMPWFNLREMSDSDLRAIYAYIHHLGAAGKPAPAYAAPGKTVATPYINFVPQNLPKTASMAH